MTSTSSTDAPARDGGRVSHIAGWLIVTAAVLFALDGLSDYVWHGELSALFDEMQRRPYVLGGGLIAMFADRRRRAAHSETARLSFAPR